MLELSIEVRTTDSPNTVAAMQNLAKYLYVSGNLDEAVEMQEQALRSSGDVSGPEHPATLAAMIWAARLYEVAGRNDDAEALHKKLATLRKKPSP